MRFYTSLKWPGTVQSQVVLSVPTTHPALNQVTQLNQLLLLISWALGGGLMVAGGTCRVQDNSWPQTIFQAILLTMAS